MILLWGTDLVLLVPSALILQYISHTSMQVEHVQCFLLMSTFLCSVNCLPQAWLLVGQAVRIAQDIGLHVRVCCPRWALRVPDFFQRAAVTQTAGHYVNREGDAPQGVVGLLHP